MGVTRARGRSSYDGARFKCALWRSGPLGLGRGLSRFDERREFAHVALQTALELARVDPHTPLSDALYALARAIDLYLHFRTPLTSEPGDVRDALDQTMR